MKRFLGISAFCLLLSVSINSCSTCGHCENAKGEWTSYKFCKYNGKTVYNDAITECQISGGYWVLNSVSFR